MFNYTYNISITLVWGAYIIEVILMDSWTIDKIEEKIENIKNEIILIENLLKGLK